MTLHWIDGTKDNGRRYTFGIVSVDGRVVEAAPCSMWLRVRVEGKTEKRRVLGAETWKVLAWWKRRGATVVSREVCG